MLGDRASFELDHFAHNYHEGQTEQPDIPELDRQCCEHHHALKSRWIWGAKMPGWLRTFHLLQHGKSEQKVPGNDLCARQWFVCQTMNCMPDNDLCARQWFVCQTMVWLPDNDLCARQWCVSVPDNDLCARQGFVCQTMICMPDNDLCAACKGIENTNAWHHECWMQRSRKYQRLANDVSGGIC